MAGKIQRTRVDNDCTFGQCRPKCSYPYQGRQPSCFSLGPPQYAIFAIYLRDGWCGERTNGKLSGDREFDFNS